MTAKIRLSIVLLAIGITLWLLGVLSGSDWGLIARMLGGVSFATGAVIFASSSIVELIPWLVRSAGGRESGPVWEGEILHIDGGEHKIRYDFDG